MFITTIFFCIFLFHTGYVTDHVTLTQEHSKLYHYLSEFEADAKRKLAMEARRFELLSPLLKALNMSSYEVLHKQVTTPSRCIFFIMFFLKFVFLHFTTWCIMFIFPFDMLLLLCFKISYELGESALSMLNIKLDKFRDRDAAKTGGEINEKLLKKAEVAKCNEYSKMGIAMFAHFTYCYAANKDRDNTKTIQFLEAQPLYALVSMGCTEPDESMYFSIATIFNDRFIVFLYGFIFIGAI